MVAVYILHWDSISKPADGPLPPARAHQASLELPSVNKVQVSKVHQTRYGFHHRLFDMSIADTKSVVYIKTADSVLCPPTLRNCFEAGNL